MSMHLIYHRTVVNETLSHFYGNNKHIENASSNRFKSNSFSKYSLY